MLKFLLAGVVHSQYLGGGQKRLDTKVERQARVVRPRSTRRYFKVYYFTCGLSYQFT